MHMIRPRRLTLAGALISTAIAVGPAPALAQTASSAAPGVVDLLKDTITDFRRLPSSEAITWLSIGAAAA